MDCHPVPKFTERTMEMAHAWSQKNDWFSQFFVPRGIGLVAVTGGSSLEAIAHLGCGALDAGAALFQRDVGKLKQAIAHVRQALIHVAAAIVALASSLFSPSDCMIPALKSLGLGKDLPLTSAGGITRQRVAMAASLLIGFSYAAYRYAAPLSKPIAVISRPIVNPLVLGICGLAICSVFAFGILTRRKTAMPKPSTPKIVEPTMTSLQPDFPQRLARLIDTRTLPFGRLGEEHVNAMLYQLLGKRTDTVLLLPTEQGEFTIPPFYSQVRYVVIALSLNQKTHNTAVVIDRQNNTYTYLDSCDHPCPEAVATQIRQQVPGITAGHFDQKTSQSDRWSSGLHVVENVVNFVTQRVVDNVNPSGNVLYGRQMTTFGKFAATHGFTQIDQAEAQLRSRHKEALKFAIEEIRKDSSLNPLETLFDYLEAHIKAEQEESNKSFDRFVASYQVAHERDDPLGYGLLHLLTNNAALKEAVFAKSTDETQTVSDRRQRALEDEIRRYLTIPTT